MKKNKKKLKLTKLTVANLDRVKGTGSPCGCDTYTYNRVDIYELNTTAVNCTFKSCIVCPLP
jgi:hypothetical protein